VTKITKAVEGMASVVLSPVKIVRKYASDLNLPEKMKSMAEDMVEKAKNLGDVGGIQPQTLAAAVLLFMCRVQSIEGPGVKHDHPIKTLEELATLSRMSSTTIKKAYTTIYQNKNDVVTKQFSQFLEERKVELVPLL